MIILEPQNLDEIKIWKGKEKKKVKEESFVESEDQNEEKENIIVEDDDYYSNGSIRDDWLDYLIFLYFWEWLW